MLSYFVVKVENLTFVTVREYKPDFSLIIIHSGNGNSFMQVGAMSSNIHQLLSCDIVVQKASCGYLNLRVNPNSELKPLNFQRK
jgi:hypothetical protein